MPKNIRRFLLGGMLVVFAALLLGPALVGASSHCVELPGGDLRCPPNTPTKFIEKLGKIGNFLFTLLLALSVVFIVAAAILYVTASGNAEKIGKAHKMIIYALIAVIVGTVAVGLVKAVIVFFTDEPGGG